MTIKTNAAVELAKMGFSVFPIKDGAKFPPLVRNWPENALADETLVRLTWDQNPTANIGIHCKGYIVVDVDTKKGGLQSLQAYDMEQLPSTLTTRTPTGGLHLFYKLPDDHPGVKNGVDVLGPGLDIRSTRGYVVAPGSEVEAGTYKFEADKPMAMASEWLVQRLERFTERERSGEVNIEDASDAIVRAAREWLQTAERSVKGQGGDETAFKVACQLRDRGLSYDQACELMRSDAWDNGCGWRAGKLESKPIRSAYRYAENKPGCKVATDADFEGAPVAPEKPPKPRTMRAESLAEFAQKGVVSASYVIRNVLYRGTIAQLYGLPGKGKTFVALDMAYHVAAGMDWMGHKVRQCPVLYLSFEAFNGLRNRGAALVKKYGNADVPLYRVDASRLNLSKPEDRKELAEIIAELPEVPGLVICDTFARALSNNGADENSAQDVGAFVAAIQGLASRGMCVMTIHHPNKRETGPRGSSAMHGALDTEMHVDNGAIYVTKQRDVELVKPMGFKLVPTPVGEDEYGDVVTSCFVEPVAEVVPTSGPKLVEGSWPYNVFHAMVDARPNNEPISIDELLDILTEAGLELNRRVLWNTLDKLKRKMNLIVQNEHNLYQRRLE